jgi:MFS family permease
MMDNLGAVLGPLLALGLVAAVGVRWAIGLAVIPGLLAAAAIVYAIRPHPKPILRERVPLRIRVRPVLRGRVGRLMAAIACFEVGNIAATLLILRATEQLTPGHGIDTATSLALLLYTGYNLAATAASSPAGRVADRLGDRGPTWVLTAGVGLFAAAYAGFAANTTNLVLLALPFLAAGVAIGAVETAQHSAVAALAPPQVRGSAFGLLATVQAVGNLAASGIAGILWTVVSPTVAFGYLTAWMLLAGAALLLTATSNPAPPPRPENRRRCPHRASTPAADTPAGQTRLPL